ncbi:MAG: hypothetical protein ACR2HA_13030 [Nocardioides sp.]
MTTWVRGGLGGAGVALMLWGAWLVLGLDLPDLLEIGAWLTGGVLVHDFVVAPLVVLVWYVVVRLLPPWARAPFVAAAVVLGTITLAVLPSLGRFGAKPDDPFLLNRPYLAWWFALAVVLLVVAAGWALAARRSADRRTQAP